MARALGPTAASDSGSYKGDQFLAQDERFCEIRQLRATDPVITFGPMALDPLLDQITPPLQGLLVVSPDGRIQFATARANRWLKEFLLSRSDRLPPALADWLEEAVSMGQPSRFIVDQPEKRLRIQVLCREASSVCLLLESVPRMCGSTSLRSDMVSRIKGRRKLRTNAIAAVVRSALTQRQIEVLSWVARGKTNAEIGEILSLKTGTVGKYLERIFPKLGVENRTAAASFVLRTNQAV